MYYCDLSDSDYEDFRKKVGYRIYEEGKPASEVNVGWLDEHHPYLRGEVPEPYLERLWFFCYNSMVHPTLGYHRCPFCGKTGVRIQRGDEECGLGAGEIRVLGNHDIVYAAPNLIYHYITAHQYCPPSEFLQAVMDSPFPGSPEYDAVMKVYIYRPRLMAELATHDKPLRGVLVL